MRENRTAFRYGIWNPNEHKALPRPPAQLPKARPGAVEGTVVCGLTGKKVTFAALMLGKIINTGPIAYVAQVILDGKGTVSGSGTFDVNGTFHTGSITGTYAESSNCTGTIQMTPTGSSTLNFAFVVVNAGNELLLVDTDSNASVVGYMQH